MLVLVAGTGVLAVLQDALALAVLGIIAGFAAPILISTGSGSHVVLFSYYALLNLAIFAIAWQQAVARAEPARFRVHVGDRHGLGRAALRARTVRAAPNRSWCCSSRSISRSRSCTRAERDPARRDLVDGTLVFGNPLIAFALQAALLDGDRMPLAYSRARARGRVCAARAGC